jgi:hypothetical protein
VAQAIGEHRRDDTQHFAGARGDSPARASRRGASNDLCDKVRALLATDPEFARQWVALLARQLHSARARLEQVALKSAAERVLHYLRTEGKGPR